MRALLGDGREQLVLRLEAPPEILKPKAFLMQVARNLFLSHCRRDARPSELDLFSLKARGQTEAAGQVEAITLQQIIQGLPQPLRDVSCSAVSAA